MDKSQLPLTGVPVVLVSFKAAGGGEGGRGNDCHVSRVVFASESSMRDDDDDFGNSILVVELNSHS